MATFKENQDFINAVIGEDLLDTAIDHLQNTMLPGEVFTEVQLTEWCIENGDQHLSPDDVFDDSELSEWARENGFIKEDEEDVIDD